MVGTRTTRESARLLTQLLRANLRRTLWHELAHNFDRPINTTYVTEFRAIGEWSGSEQPGLVQSTDERWYHNQVAGDPLDGFARNYGKTNPMEDWATTFAAAVSIFQERAYNGQNHEDLAERIAPRLEVMDEFFASFE